MAKNRAKQLRDFLAENPLCIYCGGVTPATTRDHAPSRQVFYLRQWPEGYVFPSCDTCNSAVKDAEQVMALISRITLAPKTPRETREFVEIVRAVRNNYPAVLKEMRATPEQTAEYLSKPWLPALSKAGLAAPEPLSLRGPLVRQHAEMFARKLFTALHYKEFRKIIPPEGGIVWRWYANTERFDGALPDEFTRLIQQRPTIRHTRRDLTDQFFYTFAKATDGEVAGYYAMFRQSFAMLGFVEMDAREFESVTPGIKILRPRSPAESTRAA
jgi:hypothetical protein